MLRLGCSGATASVAAHFPSYKAANAGSIGP
jgi:hypothetical protein